MKYSITEGAYILANLGTGKTVTISLYKLLDGSVVTLTSNIMIEIATTGIYKWHTSNITIQPTTYTEYLFIATDGISSQYGKFILEKPISFQIWDEPLTGETHNVPTSAGRRLRQLGGNVVLDGIAVGGGTNGNQIQLDNNASTIDGAYDPSVIAIVLGTGAGQCRNILDYNGATRTATVDRTWKVIPDDTSEYIIFANAGREHINEGLIRGGTNVTAILNTAASNADNAYNYQIIMIRSGHGEDQARIITAYNGTTKTITIDRPWDVIPDTTSGYVILPYLATSAEIDTKIRELHELQGLESGNQMKINKLTGHRTTNNITLKIEESSSSVTVDRI